ncbi:MAG TPA: PIN domain-containing protein [Chloroflexi bacterium]|nr:PIN domain-containing protein [Chloroflexota bacterium]
MEWLEGLHGTTVGLDTAPLLYFVGRHPRYLELVRDLFQAVDRGDVAIVTSTITLTEVLVHPLRQRNVELVRRYRDVLLYSPGLSMLPVSPRVAEEAARLRASYGFKTPDAIHLATAILAGGQTFLTNDKRLAKPLSIQVLILDDLLEGR